MKNGQDKSNLLEWKQKIIETVDINITCLLQKNSSNHFKNFSNNKLAMDHLKNLHDKYVIATIDKATSNGAFICQRLYALVQVKELGIDEDKSNNQNTYVLVISLKLALTIMKLF